MKRETKKAKIEVGMIHVHHVGPHAYYYPMGTNEPRYANIDDALRRARDGKDFFHYWVQEFGKPATRLPRRK